MESKGMDADKIKGLKQGIEDADAVAIGAGAGLSASAGYAYAGERFQRHFRDFIDRYGFEDMYTGGFHPFETLEEHWAYWSRYIYLNRYLDEDNGTYRALRRLMEGRDYQVITTNVDHCFQRAGFDKDRLFYTQGDFGLFQCPLPCHQATYDNEGIVTRMYEEQRDMRIPTALIPRCPACHRPMAMNLRVDGTFVEDEGWHRAMERYQDFLRRHRDGRVLFLELGVGYHTAGIIKHPFWQMASEWRDASYVCVNEGQAYAPEELKGKSLCIDGDIGMALRRVAAL